MNTADLMQQDSLAREKIAQQIHSNFFVEAGAGSGKTTILVKRMVAMIEAGLDVSHICAITFTKAAAGEFYDRFQKALIKRSTDETASPEIRQRCIDAINNIDLCFMGTIDAFCNMILSEHPAKARIPSSSAVLSKEDMKAQYKKAYSQVQKGGYGSELRQLCRNFRNAQSSPDKFFYDHIGTLMETRNYRHAYDAVPSNDIDTIYKERIETIRSVLQILLDNPTWIQTGSDGARKAWKTLQEKQALLFGSWQDNLGQVVSALKKIKEIRILPSVDINLFGPRGTAIFELCPSKKWYCLTESAANDFAVFWEEVQASATMAFLTAAVEQIAEDLRKEGKLSFFDYLLYLRDTLKEDAKNGGKLIGHIYDRHKYFLIDEFQDTNPMQAEVFFYLTAQDPQEDWRKCVPHPGSLFIVGDPKQSIYRFRYADVSAFLRIKEMFTGEVGEVVYLTRNFRSTHKMRRWFNRVFQALLPDTTKIQCKFELIPLEPVPADDGSFDGVYSYDTQQNPLEDSEAVAKIIEQIVNNPAYKIPLDDGTFRPVSYRDIMLITPSKKKMGEYIKTFVAQDIPVRVEGKVLFDHCPSLVAVSRIFAAVAEPDSVQAVVAALTCKRFGFDLNRIHHFKNANRGLSPFATHTGDAELSAALQELNAFVVRSHKMSAAALFTVILEDLQIFKYVSSKNLECLYFALELLRSAEAGGQFSSLSQAAAFLNSLITGKSETERAISLIKDEDRIHMANLHKVKGLEAPIVILADPNGKSKTPTIRADQEGEPQCWLFDILAKKKYEAEYDAEKACLEAEADRLLYVAATRAKRVLIIADPGLTKDGKRRASPWKFLLDYCEGEIFDIFTKIPIPVKAPPSAVDAAELYAAAENRLAGTVSTTNSYAILRPSQVKLKGKTSAEDDFEDEKEDNVRTHTVRTNATVIGTLVHSLMEAMVSSRNTAPLAALVRDIASEYDAESENYIQLLSKVGTTIQNGGFPQESAAPQDILPALLAADEVYCEVPFCRKSGSDIWHGIMDVVYRIGDQWFILDYKTNADAHGLEEKYKDQLDAYVEAFRELTGCTAIPLIYHIDV